MATITKKTTTDFSWADLTGLSVGDEISETLKNGEQVTLVVMDDGIIGFKNCLAETHYMNERWTNKGGWEACDMRRYLNETVFALLPDELQAVIKPRNGDKLWLFSEVEVFGEHIWGEGNEGDKHIEYYKTPANRVKTLGEGGDPDWWWLASPSSVHATNFCFVNHLRPFLLRRRL